MSDPDLLDVGDNIADAPAFYTGTGASSLVPSIFPVAIAGRAYMIDQQSGEFASGFEERIRESVDQEVEPGESTINPQGLWRRGSTSWHVGAGQEYGDTASQPYRFWKSKGVNPWTKGRLTLHKDVKVALSSANTNLPMVTVGSYLYVGDGNTLKYTTDPFASSPTWTSVTTDAPANKAITALASDGTKVYIAYVDSGIYSTALGGSTVVAHYAAQGTVVGFDCLGFAKGYMLAGHDNNEGGSDSHIHIIPPAADATAHTAEYTHPIASFKWVGFVGGQNAVYAAGYSGNTSLIYKITIKTDGTLDVPVVALELPTSEIVSSISAYVGFILIGSNKGVRFCSTDENSNLVAGPLIPTSNAVKGFTAEDRFVWFAHTNYDGVSTGLTRMDLSVFSGTNSPAYATDLMYTSTAAVLDVETFGGKRVFTVSGVGVVAEDADNYVASGNIELGKFRWGIPDRKFVVKIDVRTEPLAGSVEVLTSLDGGAYVAAGSTSVPNTIEMTFGGPENKAIEAGFKIVLSSNNDNSAGPILTRFSSRAYVTPARSEQFSIPIMLHQQIDIWDQTYTFDVNAEKAFLRDLIKNPRIVTLQIGDELYSVVAENMRWVPADARDSTWVWDGTAILTLRSIQE